MDILLYLFIHVNIGCIFGCLSAAQNRQRSTFANYTHRPRKLFKLNWYQTQENQFVVPLNYIPAVQSKNAVSANIKHGRYFHQTSIFWAIYYLWYKKLYVHMVDMVDTVFSYGRALIVCYSLHESSKVIECSLPEIWNADTAFLLGGQIPLTIVCYETRYRSSRKVYLTREEAALIMKTNKP